MYCYITYCYVLSFIHFFPPVVQKLTCLFVMNFESSNSNNILHAENEIHLEKLLNDLCKDDEKLKYIDSERDNELLEENIGNKDGNSSRRLTKVIESLV